MGRASIADAALPAPDPKRPRKGYLYRHWDLDGRLLYVGVTSHLRHRDRSHAKTSRWMIFHVITTAERHPSEGDAFQAERRVIPAEQPLFNIDQNDNASARLRRAVYLSNGARQVRYLTPSATGTWEYQFVWWTSLRQRISDVLAGFTDVAEEATVVDMLVGGLQPLEATREVLARREPGQTPTGGLVNRRSGNSGPQWPFPFVSLGLGDRCR